MQGTILKLLLHKFMDLIWQVVIFMTETFSSNEKLCIIIASNNCHSSSCRLVDKNEEDRVKCPDDGDLMYFTR